VNLTKGVKALDAGALPLPANGEDLVLVDDKENGVWHLLDRL
jgi:hypothetical protein